MLPAADGGKESGYALEHIYRGIPVFMGNLPREHHVAVQNGPHRIGNDLIHIVTFDQNGIDSSN